MVSTTVYNRPTYSTFSENQPTLHNSQTTSMAPNLKGVWIIGPWNKKKNNLQDDIWHVGISLLMTWSGDVYKNSFVMRKQSSVREVVSGDRKEEEEETWERKAKRAENSRNQECQMETRCRTEQQQWKGKLVRHKFRWHGSFWGSDWGREKLHLNTVCVCPVACRVWLFALHGL